MKENTSINKTSKWSTQSQLNEAKVNKILLNSFPNEQKLAFIIGGNISTMNMEELLIIFQKFTLNSIIETAGIKTSSEVEQIIDLQW